MQSLEAIHELVAKVVQGESEVRMDHGKDERTRNKKNCFCFCFFYKGEGSEV